jgi:hypothetical protein
MTDADLARSLRLNHAQEWHRSLAATSAIGSTAHAGALRAPFIVRAASSRRLEPVAGEDWLAVRRLRLAVRPALFARHRQSASKRDIRWLRDRRSAHAKQRFRLEPLSPTRARRIQELRADAKRLLP